MALANVSAVGRPSASGYTQIVLDEVREQIKASDRVLREARARRDLIREVAEHFPGSTRTFLSGSIAHGTVNKPVSDADAGVVLGRDYYPNLGPDGGGQGPQGIVEDLREFIRNALTDEYPGARCYITKRAIKVTFDEPIEGQDPSVDLVVALDRLGKPGLWIPDTLTNTWDPSHPERHSELVREANVRTASVYARVVRLAKANTKGYSEPALSSFNLTALALPSVEEGNLPMNLLSFFQYSAQDLSRRLTPDPAGVSLPIKVLVDDRQIAVGRMTQAAEALARAIAHDDDEELVREALAEVFPDQLERPGRSPYIGHLRDELANGSQGIRMGTAIGLGVNAAGRAIKSTRSHGGRRGDGA